MNRARIAGFAKGLDPTYRPMSAILIRIGLSAIAVIDADLHDVDALASIAVEDGAPGGIGEARRVS